QPGSGHRGTLASLLEREFTAVHANADAVTGGELVAQNALRERVLDLLLDRALERPRAVHWIEAGLADQITRLVVQLELEVAFEQSAPQVLQLDLHDRPDLLGAQRMKHDDVVHAIDEFGAEV